MCCRHCKDVQSCVGLCAKESAEEEVFIMSTSKRHSSNQCCHSCENTCTRSSTSTEPPATPDSSLTSLNWLHSLRVMDMFSLPDGTPYVKPISPSGDSEDSFSWEPASSSNEDKKCRANCGMSLSPLRRCLLQSAEFVSSPKKYRNTTQKPPFCYSTLIYLAIKFSKKEQATLNEIYRWIKEHFKYYRTAESTWQNSIRHNLSLNEFFMKVPRQAGSAGKGSYWKLNPEYEIIFSDHSKALRTEHSYSVLKAKGHKRGHALDGSRKETYNSRKHARPPSSTDLCGLPGDLDWISLLGSQKVSCGLSPTQSCKPFFGSPVTGQSDIGHIAEPVMCSPLIVPPSLSSEHTDIPELSLPDDNRRSLLEEAVLKQDSPSPLLLPWAEGQSQSPNLGLPHPWAESKEVTLHQMRSHVSASHQLWSPEPTWTNSYMNNYCKKTPLLSETCIY